MRKFVVSSSQKLSERNLNVFLIKDNDKAFLNCNSHLN